VLYNHAMAKPPTIVDLEWTGSLTFAVTTAKSAMVVDGHSAAGPSPVETLAAALAGCMSADVVDILVKGRHPLSALRARLEADRAPDNPHRFVRIAIAFTVEGSVPAAAVERALALSHETYCSVWHSMRQDIPFTTRYELAADR